MSDTAAAPAPAAPAPAPAAEVPITSPTSAPTPIGSQAPSKPTGDVEGSPHRPQSRREAIQAAFKRAEERGKPEPARARMGHNNPPEETKVERAKPKPEPINLKQRPKDDDDKPARDRGEHGHFVKRQETREGAPTQPGAGQQQQRPAAPAIKQLPEGTPFRDAPPRMKEHARAEWHATPESVRGEVHRMHHEFGRAYQQYRGDHEAMNAIRPYHDLARQQGNSLDRVLANYTGMEHLLRTDLIGGLDLLVNNLNLQTPQGQKITLADVAWHILNHSPEQHKLVQQQNAQNAQTHQIGQLHQMVQTLAQGFGQMQYERRFAQTRGAIDQFADKHPRLDELGDLIRQEILLGFSLDEAYRRAELLRPATHAAQTRTPPAQTRTPDRSIRGAPDGGPSNGHARRADKPVSRREALANAMKRANGSL